MLITDAGLVPCADWNCRPGWRADRVQGYHHRGRRRAHGDRAGGRGPARARRFRPGRALARAGPAHASADHRRMLHAVEAALGDVFTDAP